MLHCSRSAHRDVEGGQGRVSRRTRGRKPAGWGVVMMDSEELPTSAGGEGMEAGSGWVRRSGCRENSERERLWQGFGRGPGERLMFF